MKHFLLQGGTVVTADGERHTDLSWKDGTVHLGKGSERSGDMLNVRGNFIYPGFIDNHVHFREPGFPHKGDLRSEGASALAGGVTTACDMPNTDPPTVTIEAFADKVRRAEGAPIDMRFYFGMTNREHMAQFETLMRACDEVSMKLKESLCGVKIFLEHSTGNQRLETGMVDDVFRMCQELNVLLMAHCEDPAINARAERAHEGIRDVHLHSVIRPPASEAKSIRDCIERVRAFGTRFHIAHISTLQGVNLLRDAKADGLPITGEATTHNLFATTDDYKTLKTRIKMNPPIRGTEHRDALWRGIADGTIDIVATDHAPHTIAEKNNPDPLSAPSGVPGVETRIPLLLSVAADHWPHPTSKRPDFAHLTYRDIHRLCVKNPNDIFGLGKADLLDGSRSDIVIVDPDKEWIIRAENLLSKCGWTPYEGWTVKGSIERVLMAR